MICAKVRNVVNVALQLTTMLSWCNVPGWCSSRDVFITHLMEDKQLKDIRPSRVTQCLN